MALLSIRDTLIYQGTFLVFTSEVCVGVSVEWCQWHSAGRGQGCYPSSYNAQNSLHDKELSDPNVSSVEAEKLWPMKSTNSLRMVKWITFLVDVWFQSILSCPNAQLNLKSGKKKKKKTHIHGLHTDWCKSQFNMNYCEGSELSW